MVVLIILFILFVPLPKEIANCLQEIDGALRTIKSYEKENEENV